MSAGRTIGSRIVSRWWLVLLVTLLGAGAGYAYSVSRSATYEASTSLMIGRPLTDPQVDQDAIETSLRLASTYADLAIRQPVLDGAVAQLGLDVPWQEVRDRVHASVPREDVPLVVVTADGPSPAEATALAAAVGDQLVALSPASSESLRVGEVEAFVQDRLERTQTLIDERQAEVTHLRQEASEASGPSLDDLRAQIARAEADLLDLQQSYSTLLAFASSNGVTNAVDILEAPSAGVDPIGPTTPVAIIAGAVAGFALGILLAYAFGSTRRPTRMPQPPGTGGRSPLDPDWSGLAAGQRGSDRT